MTRCKNTATLEHKTTNRNSETTAYDRKKDSEKHDKYSCIKKYSPSEKKEIIKAFEKLQQMIEIEESYGVPFEKIFNNETLKYDVLGDGFYTFKAHGKDKSQIRLLYRFIRISERKFEVELHMAAIKRKTNKDYIKEFQSYVACYA